MHRDRRRKAGEDLSLFDPAGRRLLEQVDGALRAQQGGVGMERHAGAGPEVQFQSLD